MGGAFTYFKTVSPTGRPESETGTERDIRSRQLDELIAMSDEARRDAYGPNSDEDARNFYNLQERSRKMPTFRPRISAPQLQLLLLSEAADLTDADVRVFINKGDERDKNREKAFQQHWRQEFFGLQLAMAQIFAKFSGTSFLQVGNDPYANKGHGKVWLRARHQENVHCDPISWWPPDWSWQIIEDFMPLDRIRQVFGEPATRIKPKGQKAKEMAGPPAGQLEMPPGPMSQTIRGIPTKGDDEVGGPLKVRYGYVIDSSMRELTNDEELVFASKNIPTKLKDGSKVVVPQYPEGRMIVDCEGTVLSDGDSWLPLGDLWPATPVWAVPPWDTVWCPNPTRYTKSLQDAAEWGMTQNYENSRRLNNGMIVIHESTGLNANSVGGLPGEIVMVAANSQPGAGIDIKYPPPFPPQMLQLPTSYLALQKELRGATPARTGNLNPGNVGPDLFEAAVSQSQSGERLTAKFFAWSVQKSIELLFYVMSKSFTETRKFREKGKTVEWEPDVNAEEYDVWLPEGSIRPMSATALRQMVMELKKNGMIDVKHALDLLDIPDSEEISEAISNEMKLAALAKLGRK